MNVPRNSGGFKHNLNLQLIINHKSIENEIRLDLNQDSKLIESISVFKIFKILTGNDIIRIRSQDSGINLVANDASKKI